MAIITISRGSFSKGQEVSEKVAQRLGYECISRDVLLEASKEFNIPEIKLVRAIHDAPSILDRFVYGKEKYIAFSQAAICRHLVKDNVVYCGLAGHFFVKKVSHVLKVRILADFDDRVKNEMEREGISAQQAVQLLRKDDEERRKWSHYLYGIDTRDPSLYDMTLHIKKITTDDAVEIICNTAVLEHFKKTDESQRAMEDLALAAAVKAALVASKPDVEVHALNGIVDIKAAAPEARQPAITEELKKAAQSVAGVKEARIHITPSDPVD
jgi:cytidylate kinase